MGWEDLFRIVFKPKSILAFLVASGVVFIFIGGLLLAASSKVSFLGSASLYFIGFGLLFFFLGIGGWLLYILPHIARNW